MKLHVQSLCEENVSDRESVFVNAVVSRYKKQIIGQFYNIIFGLGLFSNAIRGVGGISAALAAISFDDDYVNKRKESQKQKIGSAKEGFTEGGQALAQGMWVYLQPHPRLDHILTSSFCI